MQRVRVRPIAVDIHGYSLVAAWHCLFARTRSQKESRLRMLAQRRHSGTARRGPAAGRPFAWGMAVLLGGGAGLVAPWATAASAAAPAPAAAPGAAAATRSATVRTLADSGPGSLRAAISAADAAPRGTATVIRFAVTGTITLRAKLPTVTRQVTIDGTSAPGYRAGRAPLVAINASGNAGLWFAAGSARSQLLGLAVDRASWAGVTLAAGSITLNGDYLGLDLAGRAAGNRGPGLDVIASSSGNFIGRNPSGRPGTVANVISGNGHDGIVLSGSSGNTLVANRIGTNPSGTAAIGNGGRGSGLILVHAARDNELGGTAFTDPATGQANNPTGDKGTVPAVFVVPPLGNLISGNARNGVAIDSGSAGNHLNGNFIGTTANGDHALGNGSNGVLISKSDDNSLTGCTFINNPFVYYNVISGNNRNGLSIMSSDGTVVQGNFFGAAADNAAAVPNRLDGIRVDGTSADTKVGGVIPLGNVSAGNGRNGIEVAGRARTFTTFNTFGGLLAFKGAAPNGRDGLLITSSGRGNLVRTNVFSGNRRNGIELGGNATGVTVDPDIAGLNTKGNAVLPNGGDGLLVNGNAHGNVIGGSLRSVIPQDTFSGNAGYGIEITGRAHGNRVTTAFVGTALLGVNALANQRGGILIAGSAAGNFIGLARSPLPANLISGNRGLGVTLARGTRGNEVLRNYIGLNRLGRPLRNTGGAIRDAGRGNIVRGNRT
jgi:parallel beta-helix repeat protein